MSRPPRPVALIARGAGAERRRERRYQVDLPGTLRSGSAALSVLVSDVSATGALVAGDGLEDSLSGGEVVSVALEGYGEVEARVVHLGAGFCGVQFLEPHRHRDRLAEWLRGEAGP